jgi:hypothetical protein
VAAQLDPTEAPVDLVGVVWVLGAARHQVGTWDPLLGCEIYLFSFFWETFELHRAGFLPCSAQFKDSLRSPCLSSPFLSTAVLVAGEGWSLSLVFRLECQLQSQCLYSVLPTLLDWESVLFVSCPLMSWP